MSESLEFTYDTLITKTLDAFKSYYKNIDAVDSGISNKLYSYSKEITIQGRGGWSESGSGGRKSENRTTLKATITATAGTIPSPVGYDTLKKYLEDKTKEITHVSQLTDTVTAKGLLAYLQFIDFVLKSCTIVFKGVNDMNDTRAYTFPCLSTSLPTYTGFSLEKDKDNKIKADDFKSLTNNFQYVAQKYSPYLTTTSFTPSITSCCSSCSSSSSSSSCSSSCSSSSSSSSCSSSSWFIAFMNLVG